MNRPLLHAIDLASMRDWNASKALLESMDDPVAGRFFLLVCELEQEEQLNAKHSAMLRHEIGNALTIAQVNVEGVIDGVLPSTPERLDGILASLTSASAMLGELGRLPEEHPPGGAMRIETFNICSLVGAHAAAIAGLAKAKRVRVEYDPIGENVSPTSDFRGDVSRIGQILRNILLNAVRYTPPGGLVEIRCDRSGSDLTVIVKDSGAGIASEDISRLFEPGFRGKNAQGPGSGIGLSVVDNMLKSLGGNARIADGPGEAGAAFIITLPTIPLASELASAIP